MKKHIAKNCLKNVNACIEAEKQKVTKLNKVKPSFTANSEKQ